MDNWENLKYLLDVYYEQHDIPGGFHDGIRTGIMNIKQCMDELENGVVSRENIV